MAGMRQEARPAAHHLLFAEPVVSQKGKITPSFAAWNFCTLLPNFTAKATVSDLISFQQGCAFRGAWFTLELAVWGRS